MKMAQRIARRATVGAFVILLGFGVSTSRAPGTVRSVMGWSSSGAKVGCTAVTTKALVRKFVRNYDEGHVAVIDRLWAQEPYFQWFSTRAPGARLGAAAYNRSTLVSYFRARVRAHENLRVIKLGAGYDLKANIVNFAGKLVRSVGELPAGVQRHFKGAATCRLDRPLLIVWSM
jgi:hypothetical protein